MDFKTAVRTCFQKYVTFSGRASRSEFWWFVLFIVLGGIVFSIIDLMLFGTTTTTSNSVSSESDFAPLSTLFSLATLLPNISVSVRRLHDTDRSGWWWWLWLVPLIGWIILLVWYATRGTSGNNRFGPDPLGASAAGYQYDATHQSPIPSVPRKD
jgi:uncharacterized membrane protein YhaH (DUF805 family)